MSKIYNKYVELKNNGSKDTKYLFKAGIFYIFICEDAEEMSKLLNLKLTNLNENVLKCGFPTNNLSKYINLLNDYNIEFKIIDENMEKVNSISKYLNNEKIITELKKIQKLDMDNLNPRQAYDIVYSFNQLLKESELNG